LTHPLPQVVLTWISCERSVAGSVARAINYVVYRLGEELPDFYD